MSVENLRVDEPASKGWANLYMNNLTVYDTITTKNINTEHENAIYTQAYQATMGGSTTNLTLKFRNSLGLVMVEIPKFSVPNNSGNSELFITIRPVGALPDKYSSVIQNGQLVPSFYETGGVQDTEIGFIRTVDGLNGFFDLLRGNDQPYADNSKGGLLQSITLCYLSQT